MQCTLHSLNFEASFVFLDIEKYLLKYLRSIRLQITFMLKKAQQRIKLIALHELKMRKKSKLHKFCAKSMVISWKPYLRPKIAN